MEQKGVENPERFLMGEMIPPEIQQIMMQNPIIANMVAQLQQSMQTGQPIQAEGEEAPVEIPAMNTPEVGADLMGNLGNLPGRHMMG